MGKLVDFGEFEDRGGGGDTVEGPRESFISGFLANLVEGLGE